VNEIKLGSQDKKALGLARGLDLAAQRRLKTILDLAIAIGRREGLIGNNNTNTGMESCSQGRQSHRHCCHERCDGYRNTHCE